MKAPIIDQSPRYLVAAPAEQRDEFATLVSDLDLVDARAPRAPALDGGGTQHVALARRGEELDGRTGRNGIVPVGITGKGEGAVGECEDEASVADPVPVHHVRADMHRDGSAARTAGVDRHAQAL
jgi:hypothetical protein